MAKGQLRTNKETNKTAVPVGSTMSAPKAAPPQNQKR
jgi:hypothetical protein